MSSNVFISVVSGVCAVLIAVSLIILAMLYHDANLFFHQTLNDMEGFKLIADDAWKTMLLKTTFKTNERKKRANGVCGCKGNKNECPQGEAGLPGNIGPPGEDGQPGKDGRPGASGLGLQDRPGGCVACPPGPAGPTGHDGTVGEQGPPGINGLPGGNDLVGLPGPQGDKGTTGIKGLRGSQGTPGENGLCPKNNPGARGVPGPSGLYGGDGRPGASGVDGNPGATGWPGISGRYGVDGMNGAPGEYGEPGEPGLDAAYCKCPARTTNYQVEVSATEQDKERKKRLESATKAVKMFV